MIAVEVKVTAAILFGIVLVTVPRVVDKVVNIFLGEFTVVIRS